MKFIGARLKKLREARHMSLRELGELMGRSSQTLLNWEDEVTRPPRTAVYLLSTIFGVEEFYLFADNVHQMKDELNDGLKKAA